MERRIAYSAGGRRHVGRFIEPPGAIRAAVVLLPDWRGLSPLAREHADRLLQLDCAVLVADMYGDEFTPTRAEEVAPLVQRLLDQREQSVAALADCVRALGQSVPVGTPIYCLGFSAGGLIALDYGRSGARVDGIVVCSGLLKLARAGSSTRIAAPVLFLQGTRDQVSPCEVIQALIAEMDEAGNDARFLLLGETHHAFDNPEAGSDPNARLCYSARSAARAWRAIAEFIDESAAA